MNQHETELGYVENNLICEYDIETFESSPIELPPDFRIESLDELSRTPHIESHQGQGFLIHCTDFMCYVGRWEPGDFESLDPLSGRDAYIQMADGDPQLWDETLRERADRGPDWAGYTDSKWAYGSWCYVFECLHCGQRRCTWDCG